MKQLEITFDLETCSLAPDAAIMQIAAVAWERDSEQFLLIDTFNQGVDIRELFMMGGFSFSKETSDFWAEQDVKAQLAVLNAEPKRLADVVANFNYWIEDLMQDYDNILIWCQGADFDMPKLQYIYKATCHKYPLPYTNTRCARTLALEASAMFGLDNLEDIYNRYILPEELRGGVAHDALYDSHFAAFTTWSILREQKQIMSLASGVAEE